MSTVELLILAVILLLVVGVLLRIAAKSSASRTTPESRQAADPPGRRSAPTDLGVRVRELVERDRIIEAIKVVREETGLGLAEAKRAVEAVKAGKPAPLPRPVPLSPALTARVSELTGRGRVIEAVKVVREETGLGLAEAKRIVEAVERGAPPAGAPPQLDGDLATRVRELKAAGDTERAVQLVRGETGMDHAEAVAFVDALQHTGPKNADAD
ncbi:ribosomal protein L7/L12 [Thermostaphylospora chromogena]|uniref:Ribosomal protein L7/L12 n=1 Tax=Thermostaphylospora chromogena TaxID=35622 RepID=A0A1H1I2Q6_9ACTN|nr:ribosomal protein L7/L12 [Thermostaphylospora chromogena]SDR31953.1 Ribosomal protein L7/L12 [Thermostaphylospora chromogena]